MPSSPEQAIEAYRNADTVDASMALIAEDAVFLFSNGDCHHGLAAIRAALEHNAATIADDTYDISDILWLTKSKDVAVCVYNFAWTGNINGQPASGAGRGTTVLRRKGTDWKIVHEHLSRGSL